jgi:hypothetical protein
MDCVAPASVTGIARAAAQRAFLKFISIFSLWRVVAPEDLLRTFFLNER